jgi:peptide deformylase
MVCLVQAIAFYYGQCSRFVEGDVLIFEMSVLEILTDPHPLLHQPASVVTDFGDELQRLVANMIETVRVKGFDGVGGLAAPQVGVMLQVFVLVLPNQEPITVVNPDLIGASGGTNKSWEYCYSVPGKRGRIKRYRKAKITFSDVTNSQLSLELEGFIARMYLHEIDHLRGILWTDLIDSADDIMSDEEWRKWREKKEK